MDAASVPSLNPAKTHSPWTDHRALPGQTQPLASWLSWTLYSGLPLRLASTTLQGLQKRNTGLRNNLHAIFIIYPVKQEALEAPAFRHHGKFTMSTHAQVSHKLECDRYKTRLDKQGLQWFLNNHRLPQECNSSHFTRI